MILHEGSSKGESSEIGVLNESNLHIRSAGSDGRKGKSQKGWRPDFVFLSF